MVMLEFTSSRQTSSAHVDDPKKKKKKKPSYGKRNKILIRKNRVRNHNKLIC